MSLQNAEENSSRFRGGVRPEADLRLFLLSCSGQAERSRRDARSRNEVAGAAAGFAGAVCCGRTTLRRACGKSSCARASAEAMRSSGFLARQEETIWSKAAGTDGCSCETAFGVEERT